MKEPFADSDRSWAASPCSSCETSPCCTRLPLHRFHIENRDDFAAAQSMLSYPRIELGLYDSGWWMAYYLAPCRFLNPLDSKCLVHESERQPRICRDYSPVRCWYKRIFAPPPPTPASGSDLRDIRAAQARGSAPHIPGSPLDFIRFDAARLAALETMIAFDEAGELAVVPPWEELHERISAVPLVAPTAAGSPVEQSAPPPSGVARNTINLGGRPASPGGGAHPPGAAPSGSGGLVFPIRAPRSRRDLDLVRFRLGFHGVRVGVNDDEWVTVIGSPPEAARYLLLSYEQLDAFLASFAFDETGAILRAPRSFPAPPLRAPELRRGDALPSPAGSPAAGSPAPPRLP